MNASLISKGNEKIAEFSEIDDIVSIAYYLKPSNNMEET